MSDVLPVASSPSPHNPSNATSNESHHSGLPAGIAIWIWIVGFFVAFNVCAAMCKCRRTANTSSSSAASARVDAFAQHAAGETHRAAASQPTQRPFVVKEVESGAAEIPIIVVQPNKDIAIVHDGDDDDSSHDGRHRDASGVVVFSRLSIALPSFDRWKQNTSFLLNPRSWSLPRGGSRHAAPSTPAAANHSSFNCHVDAAGTANFDDEQGVAHHGIEGNARALQSMPEHETALLTPPQLSAEVQMQPLSGLATRSLGRYRSASQPDAMRRNRAAASPLRSVSLSSAAHRSTPS